MRKTLTLLALCLLLSSRVFAQTTTVNVGFTTPDTLTNIAADTWGFTLDAQPSIQVFPVCTSGGVPLISTCQFPISNFNASIAHTFVLKVSNAIGSAQSSGSYTPPTGGAPSPPSTPTIKIVITFP